MLSGSSGRVETDRVRLLAAHGAAALSLRWFGDAGQPATLSEVALETFTPALDRLAAASDRLAVVGASKGAEAALLLAAAHQRIDAVAALSPTSVVWQDLAERGEGERARSSFTHRGSALAFVPYHRAWSPNPGVGAPAYRGLYETSLAAGGEQVAAARIEVEAITGQVLLAAGGDDQVWPSQDFAAQITASRRAAGLPTTTVSHPQAGHRITFPSEGHPTAGMAMARGGTAAADAELGAATWAALSQMLDLT